MISSINYFDLNFNAQTMSKNNYQLHHISILTVFDCQGFINIQNVFKKISQ